MFEFLFKYRPALFQQGELTLTATPLMIAVVGAVALLVVPVALRYRRVPSGAVDRTLLTLLRLGAIAVVAVCLLQPALVLTSVVPQQSVVGVLVDDSLSMQVPDVEGQTRAEHVSALLSPERAGGLLDELAERFKVRLFGFSRDAQRIAGIGELSFSGSQSRIGTGLQQVHDELAGVPLSGLVLLSDGAASSGDQLSAALLELRSRGVKVLPMAVGQPRFQRDVEVRRVIAPRSVLAGSALQVDVTLAQTGFSGSSVELQVEDEGRLVSSQQVKFPANGEAAVATVTFTASEAGPRRFAFKVVPRDDELLADNNRRDVLIDVADRREKILYLEGEPRHEVGFLRRAVADDEGLQVVCLVRLAENHLLRLEVDDADELADGFPKTREELFQYRGIILGSIEASYFTYDQLRMISDFVNQRGGGLLLLGGRASFAEGGYRDTPLAEVIPVALGPAGGGEGETFFTSVEVRPTPLGRTHPATQLFGDVEADTGWEDLPALTTFNPLARLKPGATSLLVGHGSELAEEQVVLAHQRYGRGRALALTAHDTWKWQMQLPLEDRTHETLWRQLMRWLVSYVPDQIEVTADRDRTQVGEPVTVTAKVRDETFLEVNSARVLSTIRAPSGAETQLELEWAVEEDGAFRGSFVPEEEGLYDVGVEARSQGEDLGTASMHFESTELREELFEAERGTSVLQRIAEETDGRVYETAEVGNLVEDLAYSQEGATVREYRELWDMPALFLLLFALLFGEWALRRFRGLA